MRRIAWGIAILLVFWCPVARATPPAASPPIADTTAVRAGLIPIVWDTSDRLYAPWSAEAGARVGAAALLVTANGRAVDTLRVEWVRDDLSCLVGRGKHRFGVEGVLWLEPIARLSAGPFGTLNVPISALPVTLDPARMTSLAEKQVGVQIFQGLTRFDADLVPTLSLADSSSHEGGAVTFRISPNARFQDGRPVRAADVVATLRRALSPTMHAPRIDGLLETVAGARDFHAGRSAELTGVREIDSLHVAITTGTDLSALANALAEPAAWIVPRDAADRPGFEFQPIGSGPFRVERSDASGVTLVAAPNRTSGVDTLRFHLVHDAADAALQFELGRLDVVSPTESQEADLVRPRGESSRLPSPITLRQKEASVYYLGMNTRNPWLSDRSHRRALFAAIDRMLAVQVLVPGRSVPIDGFLPDLIRGEMIPTDDWVPGPEEAAKLGAMRPPAGGLSLWVPAGSSTGLRIAEYVQSALGRHGVRVQIVSPAWGEFMSGVNAGKADLFYLSWFAESRDPVAFLSSLFGSRNRGEGGDHTFYQNASVDSLLDAARSAPDRETYRAILGAAQRIALGDAPVIPLFQSVNVTMCQPWVEGLVLDSMGAPRYDKVEVTRGR